MRNIVGCLLMPIAFDSPLNFLSKYPVLHLCFQGTLPMSTVMTVCTLDLTLILVPVKPTMSTLTWLLQSGEESL